MYLTYYQAALRFYVHILYNVTINCWFTKVLNTQQSNVCFAFCSHTVKTQTKPWPQNWGTYRTVIFVYRYTPSNFKYCIIRNWTCFHLLKAFHPSSKRLLQLTNQRGVCRLLTSVWECPYRVARVNSKFQSHKCWSCRRAQMWVVVKLSWEGTQ